MVTGNSKSKTKSNWLALSVTLILMVCSTKPLLGHHALVRVVGFSWLHVIWKWNKSMCAWECGIRMGWVGKSTI